MISAVLLLVDGGISRLLVMEMPVLEADDKIGPSPGKNLTDGDDGWKFFTVTVQALE